MSRHEHAPECAHETMAYCKHCDVAYCKDCGREWMKPTTNWGYYSQGPQWFGHGTSIRGPQYGGENICSSHHGCK